MVASSSLFDSVLHFEVGNEDFSDHFPLGCRLRIGNTNNGINEQDRTEGMHYWQKFKWKEAYKNTFLTKFNAMYSTFKRKISHYDFSAVQHLSEFISIYHKSGENMKIKPFNNKFERITQPEWWDNECQR